MSNAALGSIGNAEDAAMILSSLRSLLHIPNVALGSMGNAEDAVMLPSSLRSSFLFRLHISNVALGSIGNAEDAVMILSSLRSSSLSSTHVKCGVRQRCECRGFCDDTTLIAIIISFFYTFQMRR